jgi:hypothetical protein
MCSSLYHFGAIADDVVARMRRAARQGVIISEPVHNWSGAPVIGGLVAALTDPGVGDYTMRFDLDGFRALIARHEGEVVHAPGDRNAVAFMRPLPPTRESA